ncbi:MAG TPA: pyridoxamine 5'-phosphate oxidase family protein [Streptosporangiaceae bacterium]
MGSPEVSRPHMPGYGIAGPAEGSGLLPWSWAAGRLSSSRNYWVTTAWPDGRPHSTPVWGMWDDSVLWFTCGVQSRKAVNLRADPRCTVTTEDAGDPVIIEGIAQVRTDDKSIRRALDLMNDKYHAGIEISFLDPARNATIEVRPAKVIGMRHGDFTGSPTRWTFLPGGRP